MDEVGMEGTGDSLFVKSGNQPGGFQGGASVTPRLFLALGLARTPSDPNPWTRRGEVTSRGLLRCSQGLWRTVSHLDTSRLSLQLTISWFRVY